MFRLPITSGVAGVDSWKCCRSPKARNNGLISCGRKKIVWGWYKVGRGGLGDGSPLLGAL